MNNVMPTHGSEWVIPGNEKAGTTRLKVPGGWIYYRWMSSDAGHVAITSTFVPDKEHAN